MKIRAIPISTEPWREADRRYEALTRERGKISFIGRGARKGKAKLAAHVEPLAVVDLELVHGARGYTVIGAERVKSFSAVSADVDKRVLCAAAASCIVHLIRHDDGDETWYRHFVDFLDFIERCPTLSETRSAFLFCGYMAKLLGILGYDMVLHDCVSCEEEILPLSFRWHDIKGGLVCTNCTLAQPQEWVTARRVEEEVVSLLRFAREAPYDDLLKMGIKAEALLSALSCIDGFARTHLPDGSRIPTWHLATTSRM